MAAAHTGSTSNSAPSPSRAAEYLAQDRFHRRFVLPATADHGELQVSYADVGRTPGSDDSSQHPTVLFIPGMFASRYLSVWMHAIAERLGVRVLIVDRPGMGHSTEVPLAQRVTTWVELVPRLLAHLQIEHVSLASHSSGTIYLLNTLIRCRDILSDRPFVALVAPWVDPAYSHVMTMRMAQSLPTSVFGVWHHMPKIASAGGTAFDKITKLLPSSSGVNAKESPPLERNRQRIESDYGLPVTLHKELQTATLKSMLNEKMVGADSEALCCLRKGPPELWGECDDYALFVRKLADLERSRRSKQGSGDGEKLRVSAYFAETDAMIGEKGQRYMEGCWKGGEGDQFQDVLDFATMTVAETDHDSVVQSVDVLERIFLSAGGARPASL